MLCASSVLKASDALQVFMCTILPISFMHVHRQ